MNLVKLRLAICGLLIPAAASAQLRSPKDLPHPVLSSAPSNNYTWAKEYDVDSRFSILIAGAVSNFTTTYQDNGTNIDFVSVQNGKRAHCYVTVARHIYIWTPRDMESLNKELNKKGDVIQTWSGSDQYRRYYYLKNFIRPRGYDTILAQFTASFSIKGNTYLFDSICEGVALSGQHQAVSRVTLIIQADPR